MLSLRSCTLLLLALAACNQPRAVQATPQASQSGCSLCHGSADNAAPPRALAGATSTGDRAVGAHQAHLRGGRFRGPVACTECHPARPTVGTTGHGDGTVDIRFGSLATTGGLSPRWDPGQPGCSATYCHGGTLAGGSVASPQWTRVDGTQAACGTCHGLPPSTLSRGGAHPQVGGGVTACAACHPQTVKADGTIDLAAGKHIDGVVQGPPAGGTCTSCHGDPGRQPPALAPAPPIDTAGGAASNQRGVGAHLAHLLAGPMAGPIACTECHAYPPVGAHPNGAVDMAFGPLASQGGASSWNGATCAVYCHGARLDGGTNRSPAWTTVDGSQAACGTCHGLPPAALSRGGSHPAAPGGVTACAGCHAQTVLADGTIDVAGGRHVDGLVQVSRVHPDGWRDPTQHGYAASQGGLQACTSCHGATLTGGSAGVSCDSCHTGGAAWRTTCTFCHGDANRAAAVAVNRFAPPRGTRGEILTAQPAVGAHQRHLTGSAASRPVACGECHAVEAVTGIAHADGQVQLRWGPLATGAGARPTYAGTSCSASYCHGAFPGGAAASPSWTGAPMTCTSCHGDPPPTGEHEVSEHQAAGCAACHGTGYSTTTANPASHLDGLKNVGGAGSRINSWSAGSRTCAPACHGSEQW
ncbi:MAG: CxxxxCH/CxxCH domain-containing protein [Deltaproteobacteria bacterium]|nr:CxxxxCH/CxxCH domain-containing protein [Deltaproteobacteria bacterium]